jgi:PilZ domain
VKCQQRCPDTNHVATDTSLYSASALLDKAVAARAAAKVKIDADTRFDELDVLLARPGDDQSTDGVWIHSGGLSTAVITELAGSKPRVSLNTAATGGRMSFTATIVGRDKFLWLNERTVVDSLRLSSPEQLTLTELRRTPRFAISDNNGLVRASLGCAGGIKPFEAKLVDLALGGATVACVSDHRLKVPKDSPLDLLLNFRGRTARLPAVVVHTRNFSTRTLRLGLRFTPMTADALTLLKDTLADLAPRRAA